MTADANRSYNTDANDLTFVNGSSTQIKLEDGAMILGGGGDNVEFKRDSGSSPVNLLFYEPPTSGTSYVSLVVPALASNRTITFPDNTGTIALTSDIVANTNLGTTDLSLDSGTAERTYTLTDNDLHFKNNGSTCVKISAADSELTLGGDGCQSVFFKSAAATPDIRIFEASGGGSNYVKLTIDAVATNTTLKFPSGTDSTLAGLAIRQTFTDRNTINQREFAVTGATDGDVIGDVVYFGSTSVNVGRLYYWDGSAWGNADADAASTSTGMLAISLGTGTASTVGMCIRGMVTISSSTGGSNGDILYVHTTANKITSTAPSGSGDIVRIVGYLMDSTNDAIYFNPDGSFVEIA